LVRKAQSFGYPKPVWKFAAALKNTAQPVTNGFDSIRQTPLLPASGKINALKMP